MAKIIKLNSLAFGTWLIYLPKLKVSYFCRVKQLVGWHLTGSSVDGEEFLEMSLKVILKCKEIGILICFQTNDMGSENLSVWKILGIGNNNICQKSTNFEPY